MGKTGGVGEGLGMVGKSLGNLGVRNGVTRGLDLALFVFLML